MNDTPSLLHSKQGQKTLKQSKTNAVLGGLPPSTDSESDEAPDDGNDSSSSNTRKEQPEPFSSSLTSPPAIRRTKKRTRDKDEKESPDQKAAHYGELMAVMKESASHLVQSSGMRDRERDSFFMWLNDFTLRMPRTNRRQFQQRTVALAMKFTPAESPQANTARPRIEQEQQRQPTMYPPPRPVGPAGTPFIDLSQAQLSQQSQ